jgi:hypothetical protein
VFVKTQILSVGDRDFFNCQRHFYCFKNQEDRLFNYCVRFNAMYLCVLRRHANFQRSKRRLKF